MLNFEPKKTRIYQAVKWGRRTIFKSSRFFKALFFILTLGFLLLFIFGTLTDRFSERGLAVSLGLVTLCLVFGIVFWEISVFFKKKLKRPKLKYSMAEAVMRPEEFNLASFLDFQSAEVCFNALKLAKRERLDGLSKELLLYCLLEPKYKEIDFIFGRGGLNLAQIKKEAKERIGQARQGWLPDADRIILEALKIAANKGKEKIEVGDILTSLAQNDESFKKTLILFDIKEEDVANLSAWFNRAEQKANWLGRFWEKGNLRKMGSLGRDWAAGFTITLDQFSRPVSDRLKKQGFRDIVGHQRAIEQIERVLAKADLNNVLLVGEPGSGRRSIVEAISQKAFLGEGQSLSYKRILEFDLAAVSNQDNAEAVLDQCFKEAIEAGNVILVINNFHNFDIASILSRYLRQPNFQIIALTTFQGLHRVLERQTALLALFEKVEVSEISANETLLFLEDIVYFFEKKHKKFISYKALREILDLSSKYITDMPFPRKALEILDEVMAYIGRIPEEKVLLPRHVRKIVSERTEIPLEQVQGTEKQLLLNLEKLIHKRIINQEEAVKELSAALRRARAELQSKSAPIGTFLFLGPTGVGKTETAKTLAAIYFRDEKRMIRLDMSEFQNITDIERLLGSERGEGLLTTPVKEDPFSLVLLDELEKAHPNILNLFLQVLDEGFLTDGFGRKIDFRQTIIIATSNAGSEIIRQDIQKDMEMDIVKEDLLDELLRKGIFRPEFLNRFDGIVIFKPLSKQNLLDISQLMLAGLKNNLKDKGIDFVITPELRQKIVELSYNPVFGAREMRRVIQDKIENPLAKAILDGRLSRGKQVTFEPDTFSFNLKVNH